MRLVDKIATARTARGLSPATQTQKYLTPNSAGACSQSKPLPQLCLTAAASFVTLKIPFISARPTLKTAIMRQMSIILERQQGKLKPQFLSEVVFYYTDTDKQQSICGYSKLI